ncbi:MAG: SAM-dependent methyltransferase [Alphaproteobacteria bacterium]|nr:SAM-dependent methyltransferase [Alphaproteobacteria bacterium]
MAEEIARDGPISVARYMELALGHPQYGYYMKRDPLGAAGDFTTAPEISQVFGELIGVWCIHAWRQMGKPARMPLVELGPGRGTLMRDLLRAASSLPEFRDALEVHLVEMSPALKALQRDTLAEENIVWHETLDTLPEGRALFVANEFFDALPIHQYEKCGDGWYERKLVLDATGHLVFTRAAMPAAIREQDGAKEGDILERSPLSTRIMGTIARRIATQGGAALVVDYGYGAGKWGDSLQAVKAHHYHPVLEAPGTADITAHVDFAALAQGAVNAGAKPWGPITQRQFLNAMGIGPRLLQLLKVAPPELREILSSGVERLIAIDQMGALFRVLAVTPLAWDEAAGVWEL